ncbi:MAG: diacylglycerol kinase family protein [Naasia sp.]
MVTRRRVVLAVNPTASFGRLPLVGARVDERLAAAGHEVIRLAAAGMTQLEADVRAAVSAGADALVVVGGDGMVHLGVGIVAETGVPLGIVPTGTGNDAARGLGIAVDDPERAITQLLAALRAPATTIDAGIASVAGREEWFVCVLSAGIDAVVNERANRMRRPRGASRYILALLRELLVLRPIDYTLTIDDGEPRRLSGVLLAVANNTSLGGGMRIAPDARLDDGVFDVVLVHPLGRLRFLRLFPRVFSGTHIGLPEVELVRARRVVIDAERIVAYADGERLGPLPVEIRVVPGALDVLV